jgi:hypothetical protein
VARRRRLPGSGAPDEVRSLVDPGERVIAWGLDRNGDPVAVSTLALYLPSPSGAHERLAFDRIANVSWAEQVLTVTMVGSGARRHRVDLDEPGEVPPAVRERVTASIAVSEHVSLRPGAGARITARRVSGQDTLTWNVLFDPGLDPSDPELRGRAEAAIARLRSSTGL